MDMEELTTFQQPEEIIRPFSISSVGETMIVCAKEHTLVMRLRYKHIVEDGAFCYELSRIKCSTSRPTGALLVHEPTLYNGSNMEQRKQMMLDQTLLPNIAKLYVSNVQSWISPCGIFENNAKEHLIANLNNLGQLTMYRQEQPSLLNWNPYVDVSDTWHSHIYNDGHRIESFEELQTMVDEMTVTSFAWESEIHRHSAHFVFATKSGKIVFCSLSSNGTTIHHVHQEEETPRVMKYVTIDNSNYILLVGLESGRVGMYRTCTKNIAESMQYVATFLEQDLTISALECEIMNNGQQLLMLVVKATYLQVIQMKYDGTVVSSALINLENFMITGIQQLSPTVYIVSTLNGYIFRIFINTYNSNIMLMKQEVSNDLTAGPYGLYGIAATRTRACWFLLGYPTKRFDHLSLRSPTCVFLARFNQCDPLKILLNNRTLKMDGYYDAAEVIRFSGNANIESLKQLEEIQFKLTLDDASMYHLKLQLVHIGAKVSFHSKRNKTVAETLHNQLEFICSLIEVIHACRTVAWLAECFTKRKKLHPLQQTAFRCLRSFIRAIADGTFPGAYEYLHAELKPKLVEALTKVDRIQTPDSEYELCSFCNLPIDSDSLTCAENHPVFRCVLTKMQIPIDVDESTCVMCQRYSIGPEVLAIVFEHVTTFADYRKCCVCDALFKTIKYV